MTCARPLSRMRKLETKETLFRNRKRILKYLVMGYLKQEGYFSTAETFASEAAVTDEYEVCDNIDLDIIVQNKRYQNIYDGNAFILSTVISERKDLPRAQHGVVFMSTKSKRLKECGSYYLTRFSKQPQFCRKVEERPPSRRPPTRKGSKPCSSGSMPGSASAEPESDPTPALEVTSLMEDVKNHNHIHQHIPAIEQKSLSAFLSSAGPEKKQLVEMLYQDIIRPTGVSWDDIKGLTEAKNLLMESVVYPVRYPEMFTGLLEPWRGILLHGPPGTGKTQLARALADQSQCTFFNITCGTVVNKWRGESEKIVKVLFELASYYSPSIIFIDEVETLVRTRAAGEHEASRRLQAQLLTELDGIQRRDGIVFLLANSNMPWDIDPAMLRRLEKRISIPLPDFKTRIELFEKYLNPGCIEVVPKVEYKELAAKTEGYSGSDIKLVCKEALMSNVRKILPHMLGKSTSTCKKDRLELSEIILAIDKTKPISKHLAQKHLDWQSEMGCS